MPSVHVRGRYIKVKAPVHCREVRIPEILKLLANGSEQVRFDGTLKGTGSKSLMASPVSKQACITKASRADSVRAAC